MATRYGVTCPDCRKPKSTENVALLDRAVRSTGGTIRIIKAHEYAICVDCYEKQFQQKYGRSQAEERAAKIAARGITEPDRYIELLKDEVPLQAEEV